MSGGLVTPEYDGQIRQTIRAVRRMQGSSAESVDPVGVRAPSRFTEHAVILDDPLAAATNSKTGATSGLCTLLKWTAADEEYTETAQQVKCWNHSEHVSHEVDTYGVIRNIDGHWHFFGDCGPMAAR